MVHGIDTFTAFFSEYENNYVIIGGTACDIHEEANAQSPRATKDIDIILVVEALSADFVARFWEFIRTGEYTQRQKGANTQLPHRHEYYRFMLPQKDEFPKQIELFSRELDSLPIAEGVHLTPIPVDEDLSSLSAILMNDDYYHFTIEHSAIEANVHIANIESLIALKCKAYVEMTERKSKGEQIDSRDIAKHKNDVFRLLSMLSADVVYNTPIALQEDMRLFIKQVQEELPNAQFFKMIGVPNITGEQMLEHLKHSFDL